MSTLEQILALDPLGSPQTAMPWILCGLALIACGVLTIFMFRTRAARRAAEAAYSASGQGSILVNRNGRILETNGPARNLLWPNHSATDALSLHAPILDLLRDPGEHHHLLRLGSQRILEISISAEDPNSKLYGFRGIGIRDVTEQRRGERHLVHMAHYDSLTGLGNRRLFIERLGNAINAAEECDDQVALLYIDLDRFKEVNDTLGHGVGDELLKTLSKRFRVAAATIRRTPTCADVTVSRLAGDEFAIVVPGIESEAQIETFAAELLSLIDEPIVIANRTLAASVSIGIALYPDHANDVEDLVKHADSALYVAKEKGRARVITYETSFSAQADRSHLIEQHLRHAISRGELALHYQPKVTKNEVVGFEALLRWHNSELGFVGPKEFIPIAEERGLINEIGTWCLDQACKQIRRWQDAGYQAVPVSVNVSSAQFRESELQSVVAAALVDHEVSPSLLEIELTETLLLDDDENTGLALRELRAIGVRIALDDFGTGYSALTYLNRFPLDVVKMDRGFLRDIEDSNAAAGIASAVITMSHSLGFEVVAEGVDSPPQADLLSAMGCDQIQGFLYSPAIPSEEATRFLAANGGERPTIAPVITEGLQVVGEADPDYEENADRDLPAAANATDETQEHPTLVLPPRILVVDSEPSTLGSVAYQMTRLAADVHLLTGLDEASLFVDQEEPVVDLMIISASEASLATGELFERVKKLATTHIPKLLVIGEEPDEAVRETIRRTGADWALWHPFGDPELAFFVNAARSARNWTGRSQSIRVPIESMAWIRAGASRATGVMTSLSRRGAFIETAEPFLPGQPIRIEFKIDGRPVSLFANVSRAQEAEGEALPAGIDIIFYEVDDITDAMIEEAVERLWMRYRP